jgi:hypothetical protein
MAALSNMGGDQTQTANFRPVVRYLRRLGCDHDSLSSHGSFADVDFFKLLDTQLRGWAGRDWNK